VLTVLKTVPNEDGEYGKKEKREQKCVTDSFFNMLRCHDKQKLSDSSGDDECTKRYLQETAAIRNAFRE
jgi:hypothetical protein